MTVMEPHTEGCHGFLANHGGGKEGRPAGFPGSMAPWPMISGPQPPGLYDSTFPWFSAIQFVVLCSSIPSLLTHRTVAERLGRGRDSAEQRNLNTGGI